MADLTIKQHDTWPPLQATLRDTDGPIDLSTVGSVKLILKGTTVVVTGPCAVTDPVAGVLEYVWVTGDTAVAEEYEGEFEITWGDGTIETVPNDTYFSVLIKEDLG